MTFLLVVLLAYTALCYTLAFWRRTVLYIPPLGRWLDRRGYVCATLGGLHCVATPSLVDYMTMTTRGGSITLWRHEGEHTRQWQRFGPLFPPLYLWFHFTRGYACNQFEEWARAAAGEPLRCGKGAP